MESEGKGSGWPNMKLMEYEMGRESFMIVAQCQEIYSYQLSGPGNLVLWWWAFWVLVNVKENKTKIGLAYRILT